MLPPSKAPSKRSGEAGREGGARLGWSRSEVRRRPRGSELRRVVDVEKEVAGLIGAEVKRGGGRETSSCAVLLMLRRRWPAWLEPK